MSVEKFYGKYRGVVLQNIDPERRGRIQVQVPDVSNLLPSSWAMPCLPFSGQQMGFFAVPQIGAGVWVEFEQGNPDYPIWSGCWYGLGTEVPTLIQPGMPPLSGVIIQTQLQNTLMVSDAPGPAGGILLKTMAGAMIAINDVGITISNGKGAVITMTGPIVDVNAGALTIT
jgi:uncharacterized protein involved in type VI secretion and phage assembly